MAATTTITARRLVTDVGSVEYPVISVDEAGRIADVDSDPSVQSTDTLVAGFFDVHTHGAAGRDVMEAGGVAVVAEFLATVGVTDFLPTTVTADLEVTLRALERLATAVEAAPERGAARAVGVHLEGPFVSHGKRGVHPPAYILPPSVAVFTRMWEAARGTIRLMTIAPEEPGAMELVAHATGLGVRVSLGHSLATAAVTREAIARGAVSATHTFNAMRAMDHREPGILGVVLDDATLYAELICDGVHVAAEGVRLWWRAKAPDRAILVTDSMAAAGMGDGAYELGGLPVTVVGPVCMSGGVLAGSVLTMEGAVERVRAVTGVDLATATRAASANPARMCGVMGEMALRAGNFCNLNRYDESGRRVAAVVRGAEVAAR